MNMKFIRNRIKDENSVMKSLERFYLQDEMKTVIKLGLVYEHP